MGAQSQGVLLGRWRISESKTPGMIAGLAYLLLHHCKQVTLRANDVPPGVIEIGAKPAFLLACRAHCCKKRGMQDVSCGCPFLGAHQKHASLPLTGAHTLVL